MARQVMAEAVGADYLPSILGGPLRVGGAAFEPGPSSPLRPLSHPSLTPGPRDILHCHHHGSCSRTNHSGSPSAKPWEWTVMGLTQSCTLS